MIEEDFFEKYNYDVDITITSKTKFSDKVIIQLLVIVLRGHWILLIRSNRK